MREDTKNNSTFMPVIINGVTDNLQIIGIKCVSKSTETYSVHMRLEIGESIVTMFATVSEGCKDEELGAKNGRTLDEMYAAYDEGAELSLYLTTSTEKGMLNAMNLTDYEPQEKRTAGGRSNRG